MINKNRNDWHRRGSKLDDERLESEKLEK